jgi:hypothetical protein
MWLLDTNALIFCHKFLKKKPFKKNYTYTTIFSLIEFPKAVKYGEIIIYYPNAITYKESLKYALKLRKKGTPIPTIDILIGTIAVEKNICLVTNDADFEVLKAVEPRLKIISSENYLENIQKIK